MQLADMWSRVEDSSETFLARHAVQHICLQQHLESHWGFPTLEVFAGGAKGQHHATRYYTLFDTPQALACNAMHQNWQRDARTPGSRGKLWVFPPFHLIGAVLNKLLVEQVNAIVILPRFLRFWTAMLKRLPIVREMPIEYYSKLYTVGSRAPRCMQGQGPDKPMSSFQTT